MRWSIVAWRGWRSRLGLSLVAALIVAALGLGITLGPLGLRPVLAAPITDTTCTSASYAAGLIAAGTNGTIVFNCAAPTDILVGSYKGIRYSPIFTTAKRREARSASFLFGSG